MAPSVKRILYNHEECLNPKVQVKARLGGMFLSPGAGETDARILGLISQPVQLVSEVTISERPCL